MDINNVDPEAETVPAMSLDQLIDEGEVSYFGLDFDPDYREEVEFE